MSASGCPSRGVSDHPETSTLRLLRAQTLRHQYQKRGRTLIRQIYGPGAVAESGPRVGVRQPRLALRPQIRVIGEHAAGQEVALDPLHQRLDAPLLVAGPRPARLGVEVEFGRQLQ